MEQQVMEQRREARIDINIRFFVHIHESENEPDMVGQSLQCEAVDFSEHGLQFSSESEISVKTLLNITIGVGEPFAMYSLRGEVRWVRRSGDLFLTGVLLLPEASMDLEQWVANSRDFVSIQGNTD